MMSRLRSTADPNDHAACDGGRVRDASSDARTRSTRAGRSTGESTFGTGRPEFKSGGGVCASRSAHGEARLHRGEMAIGGPHCGGGRPGGSGRQAHRAGKACHPRIGNPIGRREGPAHRSSRGRTHTTRRRAVRERWQCGQSRRHRSPSPRTSMLARSSNRSRAGHDPCRRSQSSPDLSSSPLSRPRPHHQRRVSRESRQGRSRTLVEVDCGRASTCFLNLNGQRFSIPRIPARGILDKASRATASLSGREPRPVPPYDISKPDVHHQRVAEGLWTGRCRPKGRRIDKGRSRQRPMRGLE
jgi:hypothetical protein